MNFGGVNVSGEGSLLRRGTWNDWNCCFSTVWVPISKSSRDRRLLSTSRCLAETGPDPDPDLLDGRPVRVADLNSTIAGGAIGGFEGKKRVDAVFPPQAKA